MTIGVAIAHASWAKGRKDALVRLCTQLNRQGCTPYIQESTRREHASTWAVERLWGWAAEQDNDVLLLNDDIEVAPNLLAACEAMLKQPTSRMISLHTNLQASRSLAQAGQRWVRTYLLSGPAYIFRRGAAKEILHLVSQMPRSFVEKYNEDNVGIQVAYRLREPIWCTIPSPVIHDVGVPSTLGYDGHPMRQSPVPYTDFPKLDLLDWSFDGTPAFIECSWMPSKSLATTECALTLGFDAETCWFCGKNKAAFGSEVTGVRACFMCLAVQAGGAIQKLANLHAQQLAKDEAAKVEAAKAAPSIRGSGVEMAESP